MALLPKNGWEVQLALIEHAASTWREPDYGIWETRGPPRHFTICKLMAWSRSIAPSRRWRAAASPAPVKK